MLFELLSLLICLGLISKKIFRAVYSDSDIYLLDDILSAVDSQVASWILHRVILGPLMNQKTRILCTHNFAVGEL